ncbi:MAG: N-acetylmuramoyl-L-alanine amidase [Suipraeoptans sp.]
MKKKVIIISAFITIIVLIIIGITIYRKSVSDTATSTSAEAETKAKELIIESEPIEDGHITDNLENEEPDDTEELIEEAVEEAPNTTANADNGIIVAIDSGHQTSGDSSHEPIGPGASETKARVTGGTTGVATGVPEYQLNLDVSLKLRDELVSRGYTVVMIRETNDVNLSNSERANIANTAGSNAFIRVHANGSSSSSTRGALALAPSNSNPYVSYIAAESQRLSQCVLDAYCGATGIGNMGIQLNDTMSGINWCTVPVTILELGFMSNPDEDVLMQNADTQSTMVIGIANGLDIYFGR